MVNHDDGINMASGKLKEQTHITNSVKIDTLKFGLYACIILVLLNINNSGNTDNKLKMHAWNMNCAIATAGSYLNVLMESSDIIALSEHNCELYKLNYVNEDFMSMAKSSANLNDEQFGVLRGHGGCAILLHKRLSNYVRPLPEYGSDRMCVIQLSFPIRVKIHVISVYLPHQTCIISEFQKELDILESVVIECQINGLVIVLGNCNIHLGPEYGPRGWGKTTPNGSKFQDMVNRCSLVIADLTEKGNSPIYTYRSGPGMSYIDHVSLTQTLVADINSCGVIPDDIRNISDHLPIYLIIMTHGIKRRRVTEQVYRQVAWNQLDEDDIKYLYTLPLEQEIKQVLG